MWTTFRHLVWHDARALRVPLALWAGILALQAGVIIAGPMLVDTFDVRGDLNAGQGAMVMRLAMTVILTALIIQRDTAVGTTAFWLTRPIPRATMWVAKLATLVGWCLVLPSVLAWALFVGLGLSAGGALAVAAQLLVEQALVVACSAIAASVTATLAHFVVTGLAGFAVFWFLMPIARTWRNALPSITFAGPDAIFFAWMTAVFAAAVVVSAHQYLTRRTVRTWLLGVLCFAAAQSTLIVVRNTPSFDPAVSSTRTYTPTSDVEVRLGGSVTDEPVMVRGTTGESTPGRALSASVWATSLSDTDALEPVGVVSSVATTSAVPPTTIRWSESVRRGTWWTNAFSAADDQPIRSIRKALEVDTLSLAPTSLTATPLFRAYLAEWPAEAYRAFAAKGGGVLRAEVLVKAYRYRVGGTMPLRAGATHATGDRRLSIDSVVRTPRGVVVTVRTAFVSPFDAVAARRGVVQYVLRNRARREAVFFTNQQTGNTFLTLGRPDGQPGTGLRRFEFDHSRSDRPDVMLTTDWLNGAELVVLEPEDLGMFTRAAEVPVLTTGALK